MSLITHALIYSGNPEEQGIASLNEWMRTVDTERRQHFCKVEMAGAGGTKCFVTDVYAAALNFFPLDELADQFADEIQWEYPGDIVMILDHENDLSISVIRPWNAEGNVITYAGGDDPSAMVIATDVTDFKRICDQYGLDDDARFYRPGSALYGVRVPKIILSAATSNRQDKWFADWIELDVLCRLAVDGEFIDERQNNASEEH